MRLLFLTDSYRPSRSACANRVSVLVQAMLDAGIDVQVLSSSDSLLGAPENYEKPDFVTFFETFPLQEKTLVNRLKNNFGGQRESIKVAAGMGDFDVVLCTTPPLLLTTSAISIAKKKNAKLVLDVRDIWPDVAIEMGTFKPNSLYGRFFSHIAKRGFKAADMVTTVSAGKVTKLASRICKAGASVHLVPNGIDESFVESTEDKAVVDQFNLDKGTVCSYVGNIGLAQGLGTLLDIAAVRPNIRFLLFGTGADKQKLEDRVHEEGITNVEFCGTVDAAGVYTVLKHSALAYVPLVSSRLKDSIPTKLYECIACGCPVLLAAQGDSVDLLEESGLGKHAAPEDPKGLLREFDALIEQKYSEEEKRNAAARMLSEHSRQKAACEFAELLLAEFEGDC